MKIFVGLGLLKLANELSAINRSFMGLSGFVRWWSEFFSANPSAVVCCRQKIIPFFQLKCNHLQNLSWMKSLLHNKKFRKKISQSRARENERFALFRERKLAFPRFLCFGATVWNFPHKHCQPSWVKSIAADVFLSFLAFLSCFETVVEASARGKSFVKFAFCVASKFLV